LIGHSKAKQAKEAARLQITADGTSALPGLRKKLNHRLHRYGRLLVVIGALLLAVASFAPPRKQAQLPAPSKFQPTSAPPNARYVGAATCTQCHDAHAAGQQQNSMAHALEAPAASRILRAHPQFNFQLGLYRYAIARQGEQSIYTVSDGAQTISAPILWAFGQGKAGQTYVFKHQGQFYESRVSFYNDINNLALTLGAPTAAPKSLTEAAGRLMQSADTKDCFGCHATAAVSEAKLQLEKMTPGITCEACHGPGAEHVELAKAGKIQATKDKRIFNPTTLGAYELSQEFCGACHRSWNEVMVMGLKGVGNVRFQPYRIHLSECYDPEDRRIACTACHNPHQSLAQDAVSYDAKCLACHQIKGVSNAATNKAAAGAACKVGTQNCASCHMPKYELPGAHFKFTDHMIRVVKDKEPFPG
jgi:hypothetical protein